jgi:hypothetical protein
MCLRFHHLEIQLDIHNGNAAVSMTSGVVTSRAQCCNITESLCLHSSKEQIDHRCLVVDFRCEHVADVESK